MEQIALIGDIHLNPKCENPTVLNNVVEGQKTFLRRLAADLKERGIKTAVFAGDIFSNHRYVSVEAINEAITFFGTLMKDVTCYVIAGNHDMLYDDSTSVSSVSMLGLLPNVNVFTDRVGKAVIDGKNWYFVPWIVPSKMEGMLEWLSKQAVSGNSENNVIVGHFEIYGALMEAGQRAESGFDVNKFYRAARHTFSGHYHCRSRMEEGGDTGHHVTYLGSPYHLSFAHVGTDCGYFIMTGDEVEFVENTESPRFIDVVDTEVTEDMADLGSVFVRYFASNDRTNEEAMKLRLELEKAGPLLIKTVPYGNGMDTTVEEQRIADDEETRRILSSDSLGMADLYMEKNPDILPELHSGEDPKAKIRAFLLEYTEKR